MNGWRDGRMVLRWTAAGMLNAERSFRRIKGYKQMPDLVTALHRPAPPRSQDTTAQTPETVRSRRVRFTPDRHPSSTELGHPRFSITDSSLPPQRPSSRVAWLAQRASDADAV